MKAFVVDDEKLSVEHISRLLYNEGIQAYGYTNPREAYEMIGIHKPEALFLDIEMPELNGLELAEQAHAMKHECEIVFITAYNQYALEAFEVNALDYLLKPILPEQIKRAVNRINQRRRLFNTDGKTDRDRIRISLLGKVSINLGDEKKPLHFITSKCAEIFSYMLLQKSEKEVSKWRLLDAIWPEKDETKGDINLRSTISRLNRTFRESNIDISMVSTGNGYRLDINEPELEVDAFLLEQYALHSERVTGDNVERYEDIILRDYDMFLEAFDSEWCNLLRTSYHRYFIRAADKLVQYYEAVPADPLRLLEVLERMLRYEPYDDKLREKALRLYKKLKGRKGAENYYRSYLDLLRRDLGLELEEKWKRIFESILAE